MTRWTQATAGVLMLAAGTVWIIQGIGALHGSFMTGSPTWLWIGVAVAVAGLALCFHALVWHRPDRGNE